LHFSSEGQISRTGELLKFEKGAIKILKGTGAPVLPVYLDELWGSIFSYEGGKFLWKIPKNWPYPVSINFGNLLPHETVTDIDTVRQAVMDLRDESIARRTEQEQQTAQARQPPNETNASGDSVGHNNSTQTSDNNAEDTV